MKLDDWKRKMKPGSGKEKAREREGERGENFYEASEFIVAIGAASVAGGWLPCPSPPFSSFSEFYLFSSFSHFE